MAYPKSDMLNNYDVYPKVFVAGKKARVHIRPLGGRQALLPDTEYPLTICALDGGKPRDFPATGDYQSLSVKTDASGNIAFEHVFTSEQEYFIRVMN